MTGAKSNKLKSFFILLLILVMSVSLVLAACSTPDEEEDDTHYSQTETDEQKISNGNFEFGTLETEAEDYPYTSPTGWSVSRDGAPASDVNSGIVDTAEFSVLLDTLMEKDSFLGWAKAKYGIDEDALKEQAENELGEGAEQSDVDDKAEELLKAEIEKNFKNPKTPKDNANGTKVLMINNYRKFSETNPQGTAQKFTSSTTITLKPDTYGKITVRVNTGDLDAMNNVDKFGANIRLENTVASVTQDAYAISSIVTDGAWKEYTFYVKANDFLSSTVKVALGLGYANPDNSADSENFVIGTAYFDDVVYEEIDAEDLPDGIDFAAANQPELKNASSKKRAEATLVNGNTALYDMNIEYYFAAATDFSVSEGTDIKTPTNKGEGASMIPDGATQKSEKNADGFKVTQTKSSTTVKLTSNQFVVNPESYVAVNFRLSMDLDKFQQSGLTVNVIDKLGADDNEQVSLDNLIIEEDGTYTVIVKNNFAADSENPDAAQPRTFELEFVFGPKNVSTTTDAAMYTTGSYTVSALSVKGGSTDADTYDDEDKFYAYYNLLNNAAGSGNVFAFAAYAGYEEDYTDETEEETYPFTTAYSDKGTITHSPALVSDYEGTYFYESDITAADASETAGLINTKYLDKYEENGSAIQGASAALGHDAADDDIQPLMIYNKTAGAYGFVSQPATVAANASASFSVRVRVTSGATAYIYLVNTQHGDEFLDPLRISFTGDDGKEYDEKLFVKVTEDMMESDGWATVNFYFTAGKDAMNYRIELWNGARVQNEEAASSAPSAGFVFFDDASTGSSAGDLTTAESSGLISESDMVEYTRKLTDKEIEYNETVTDEDDKFSYQPSVIWASDFAKYGGENKGTFVYAVYNTVNPTESTIPSDEEEDTDGGSGCQEVDASTFWLSFSSILLGVALLAAIVMLVVKSVRRRKNSKKNTAKTQYKITSRNKTNADVKAKNEKAAREKAAKETETADDAEEVNEQPAEEEYTYGDVLEDFSDDTVEEIDESIIEENEAVEESLDEAQPAPSSEEDKKE
ncbi:MAG: hypothetical protein DBX59_02120 [Bacillota bacterium]|nr:MAG: hypothetical protein DBX59_02120 [Bacillota bacterium]